MATSHDRTAPACPPSPSRRHGRRARSAGLLTALGARLLDGGGRPLGPGGAALAGVERVDLSGLDPRLARTSVVLAACSLVSLDGFSDGAPTNSSPDGNAEGAAPRAADEAGPASDGATPLGLDISAFGDQTCAVLDGSAYCWGSNTAGQLGDVQPICLKYLSNSVYRR